MLDSLLLLYFLQDITAVSTLYTYTPINQMLLTQLPLQAE